MACDWQLAGSLRFVSWHEASLVARSAFPHPITPDHIQMLTPWVLANPPVGHRLQGFSQGRRIVDVTPTPSACGRDIPWRRSEAAEGGLPRVWAETPSPPAFGKEPVHRKCVDFRLWPDSTRESGFS